MPAGRQAKLKIYFFWGALLLVLVVLFAWPKFTSPNGKAVSKWSNIGVECLNNGHTNLAQHIHPNLKILIDGVGREVPANIGILPNCMAEIHTHDTTGKIHIETIDAGKQFALKTFFDVWGEKIEKDGYDLTMFVSDINQKSNEGLDPSKNPVVVLKDADNTFNKDWGDLILKDNQQIKLRYIKK